MNSLILPLIFAVSSHSVLLYTMCIVHIVETLRHQDNLSFHLHSSRRILELFHHLVLKTNGLINTPHVCIFFGCFFILMFLTYKRRPVTGQCMEGSLVSYHICGIKALLIETQRKNNAFY